MLIYIFSLLITNNTFKINRTQNGRKALWVSFLDGLQRVLLFTENEGIAHRTETTASLQTITQSIDLRIHGIGVSIINNESGLDILYLGITSSGIIWESKKTSKKRFKEVTIHENTLLEAEYQRYLVHKSVNDVQTYTLDNKFPVRIQILDLLPCRTRTYGFLSDRL